MHHFICFFPSCHTLLTFSLADCRNGRDADFHSCFFLSHNTNNLVFEANVSQYCHPSSQHWNSFSDIKSIVLHVTLNLHVSTVLSLTQQDSTEILRHKRLTPESQSGYNLPQRTTHLIKNRKESIYFWYTVMPEMDIVQGWNWFVPLM